MERKWKGSKHKFRTESDKCPPILRALYNQAFESQGPDKVAMERTAQVARQYFQLRLGHAVTVTYLGCI